MCNLTLFIQTKIFCSVYAANFFLRKGISGLLSGDVAWGGQAAQNVSPSSKNTTNPKDSIITCGGIQGCC